jgi:hypothetical protein
MTNAAAEHTYFWVKLVSALLAIVATLAHKWVAVHAAAYYLALQRCREVVVHDGEFVKRPAIEGEFSAALIAKDYRTVLVYGQRGSGKTTFIYSALSGRRGFVSIKIDRKTGDDASKQLIDELSKSLHFFGTEQDSNFVRDVFAACPVPTTVLVSIEAKCNGEVLESVLIMCKILSYERALLGLRAARFVVDLSASRAAIDASIQIADLRCAGVHVGYFSSAEALLYATERMPKSFKDRTRRDSIARSVVEKFDERVLTLRQVCEAIKKGPPGDVAFAEATIEKEQEKEAARALSGWSVFCSSLVERLGRRADEELKEAVELLLTGPQQFDNIINTLSRETDTVLLTSRDLGLFNADAGFHPLAIDPFETTLSLSGKAIKTVSRKRYKLA